MLVEKRFEQLLFFLGESAFHPSVKDIIPYEQMSYPPAYHSLQDSFGPGCLSDKLLQHTSVEVHIEDILSVTVIPPLSHMDK